MPRPPKPNPDPNAPPAEKPVREPKDLGLNAVELSPKNRAMCEQVFVTAVREMRWLVRNKTTPATQRLAIFKALCQILNVRKIHYQGRGAIVTGEARETPRPASLTELMKQFGEEQCREAFYKAFPPQTVKIEKGTVDLESLKGL